MSSESRSHIGDIQEELWKHTRQMNKRNKTTENNPKIKQKPKTKKQECER